MSFVAKICGDKVTRVGSKGLNVTRTYIVDNSMFVPDNVSNSTKRNELGSMVIKALIVSTQLLDSLGAGTGNFCNLDRK
jgi:hypothetical protein